VLRQIARDEGGCPERAQLEKVLRLKRRFRVVRTATTTVQMERLQQEIADTIMLYTGMVRKRLKGHVRQSTVALLTGYVHFRDILNALVREQVTREDEFFWQMQLKFDMQNMLDVVYKSAYDTGGRAVPRLETAKLDVSCEVFGHARGYGFEYLGNCPRLVVTPLTERCQRSLLVALQYNYGGAPEGPFGTGKTETTKDLSRQLAKLCFVLNCSASYEYTGVSRFFKGLASSGAWVCFDEFNRMETRMLSLISQVIISIQSAIRTQATHLQLDEAKIPLEPDCAIFVTLNPGYAGRTELPGTLKAQFRAVSMVVPDAVLITEILLYSSGFIGAPQLAKKIVAVQNLADVIMQKTEIAHDFGLRSIKAIVGIAGNLKLQAQNIVDSELAEVIDDHSLSHAPYKADQVLKEVMTATEAAIAKATAGLAGDEPGKPDESPRRADGKAGGVTPGGGGPASPAAAASPALGGGKLGGTADDLAQRPALDGSDDRAYERGEAGDSLERAQSPPPEERVAPEGKEGGELYDRLWEHIPFAERQLRTVYRQLGIDPDAQYEEGVLEEYIVLKAVRDFNHSKFATEEHVLIEGVIKDVFQGAVPDLDKPVQDYGNLKAALRQSFDGRKLDFSPSLQTKALQFYEIQRTKHGCILAGEPQSGKSTLVSLVQSALNKAAMNELMLTVAEQRRLRLVALAKEYQAQIVEGALQKTHTSGKSGAQADVMGGSVKKKNKRADKEAQAKKLQQQWHEMYRKTGLTEAELDAVRAKLTVKGVQMRRMNPKGMTSDELFGAFDSETHEWREGLFTEQYRAYADQQDDKKKWILLDGPIDFMWVENLNSILDDNKKMSLPNGESIRMSEGMCILLETDHLRNVTPATVSRCGLVFLHRRETCDSKAIFNQWLRQLPPNLAEYAKDLESVANYLMVEAVRVFEVEAEAGELNFAGVDLHWLMQNFVRLLTTLVYDYFIEYERSSATAPSAANPDELGTSLFNMSLGNGWVEADPDPDMTAYTPSEPPRSAQDRSRQGSRHLDQRVKTPDARQRELEKRKRLPRCNFIDSEMRLESALKFTPIWLEAFVIFALVWTFQPVLSAAGRRHLDERLRAKYESARTDYNAYVKEKKRKLAEKTKQEKSQAPKPAAGEKNKALGRASTLSNPKATSVSGGSAAGAATSPASASGQKESQP